MAKQNKPAIRFKGFTDAWEQRKLGEVFEEYSEKNHEELPPLTIIQGGGTIRRDESERSLQYDKSSLSNYKMVNKDDFIVHLRSFEGGLEKANSQGIISPAYHTFHGENVDSRFYYAYFRSKNFINKDLKPHVYGIRDGRSIDIEGMKTIKIPCTSYAEQKSIGDFLTTLDHLITLHQRKYDKLQVLKKAMLEKMFPKNGSSVPEIRFKGFTDAWEQRKLAEIAKTTIGEFVIKSKQDDSYPYPVFNGGSSNTGYYKEFNNEGNKILVSARGANAGFVNIIKTRYWAGNSCYSVDLLDKNIFDTDFIFQEMKHKQTKFTDNQQAANIPSVSKSDVEKFIVDVPSYSEQVKIGTYFKNLDNLITLHQRELEKLQNIKKSMLEKMFV